MPYDKDGMFTWCPESCDQEGFGCVACNDEVRLSVDYSESDGESDLDETTLSEIY